MNKENFYKAEEILNDLKRSEQDLHIMKNMKEDYIENPVTSYDVENYLNVGMSNSGKHGVDFSPRLTMPIIKAIMAELKTDIELLNVEFDNIK